MKHVKEILIYTCVAYTCIVIVNALFSGATELRATGLIELLGVAIVASAITYGLDQIHLKKAFITVILQILVTIAVVFVFGFLIFSWFDYTWSQMLIALLMVLTVFVPTYFITHYKLSRQAHDINEALKKRKGEHLN